jgi:uncharacterized protein (TIGR02453 family)
MAFNGFPSDLFDFYAGLEADNSKSYWDSHKQTYETAVKAPIQALAEELETRIGPVHVFRPYRDLRFSKDKRPYQEHASLSAEDGKGGGIYVSVSASGLHLGGGYWRPAKDQVERWRQAVDDEGAGAELESLLARLGEQGFHMGYEPTLKKVPKGYRQDHPREELMRRTDFTIGASYPESEELYGPGALDVIWNGWERVQEWQGWLLQHVGPTTEPESGRRH